MVLEKDGLKMEVRNANQASAFLKSGWSEIVVPAVEYFADGVSVGVYDEADDLAQEAGKRWTKTEINRMAVDELRKLAAENGIENAEEASGADLKKTLIDKFDL